MSFMITKEIVNDIYTRYQIESTYQSAEQIYGKIFMEKYSRDKHPHLKTEWNLELMDVVPQRKGYGTIF